MLVNNINMLFALLFITIINLVISYEPKCSSCKWFLPNKNGNVDFGFCKMHKNYITNRNNNIVMYDYAKHCRDNERQCGKSGYLFEENKLNANTKYNCVDLEKKYNVNDEKYDKEILQMLKRCKKHNIQNFYKD